MLIVMHKYKMVGYQAKEDHPCVFIQSHSYDLDLDPMILILKVDLDIMKMYLCTKMKLACRGL